MYPAYTWLAAVGDLEIFADVRTRILSEDIMTDGYLTALTIIT